MSLMSTDTLPVEILVCIFRALRDMHVHSRSYGWLPVTHVCRGWRVAALNAPGLWTQIYSLDMDCVQAFLARSKNAPLDICYPRQHHRDARLTAIMSMLLSESSRLRRVELAHMDAAHTFLVHTFPDGAPLLFHLNLTYILFVEPPASLFAPLKSLIKLTDTMPKICDYGLPALQRLYLEHWPVASISSLRGLVNSSLRSLTIIQPHARYSCDTWANILRELPLLENLTLAGVFPRWDASPSPPGPIHLPHISSLTFREDDSVQQLSLLQHIVVSSNVRINFSAYDGFGRLEIPFERYINILNTSSQKLTREQHTKPIYPTYLDLRVIDKGDSRDTPQSYSLTVTLCAVPGDTDKSYCPRLFSDDGTEPTLLLDIPSLHASPIDFCPPLCNMLLTTFSWSELRELCLGSSILSVQRSEVAPVLPAFNDLFLRMKNLRLLSIGNKYLTDYLFTLLGGTVGTRGASDADEDTGGTEQVLFPLLETLAIKVFYHTENTEYELLRRALLSRKEAGYPVVKVHICLSAGRASNSSDLIAKVKAAAAPLASVGCSVDICTIKNGDWCIQKLTAEVSVTGCGNGHWL